MSKNNTGAIAFVGLGLLGAGGAAAFMLAQKQDKDPPKDLPDDPTIKPHATIGLPYKPGAQHGSSNAIIACSQKPVVHPAGVSRGKYSLADWLTWVTFLETWPIAPIKFEKSDDRWAAEWRRLYAFVHACLKKQDDTGKKGHSTVGHPYSPGRSHERHNAITAVRMRPMRHPAGPRGAGKPIDDWLSTFVYLESYPQGPTKIKSPNDQWARAWMRIREHVRAALKTPKTTDPKDDPKDKSHPVIGGKFRIGQGHERHNAVVAVKLRPVYHPRGRTQSGSALDVWLANVAYWETWNKGPTTIHDPNGGYARSWKEIRKYVRDAIAVKKDTGDDKKTPKTIGPPFRPGRANEKRNSVLAVTRKPAAHPNGKRRTTQPDDIWFSNIAYWESYPGGPVTLSQSSKHRAYARAWKRIRGYVRKVIADAKTTTPDTTTPDTTTPDTTTPDTTTPDTTTPGKYRTFGAPFAIAQSKKNAVIAVSRKPQKHPNGRQRGNTSGETWYTNVAFWETVGPNGPLKIVRGAKFYEIHKQLWLKIRGYVRSLLEKQAKNPGATPGSDKNKDVPHGLKPARSIPSTDVERSNAKVASDRRITNYPNNPAPYNRWQSGKQEWLDWLANVVLWATYPDAPIKLSKSSRDRKYVKAWVRIRKRVAALKPTAPAPSSSVARPSTTRPGPAPALPSGESRIATGKADKASASEMRNAAIVVATQPRSFEKTGERYKRSQSLADWYTNVAYWSTYPEGPRKLSKSSSDKPYVAAWIRVNRHVKQMMALRRKLPGSNPTGAAGANADAQWLQWALAMRVSSNLKTPAHLADSFRKGTHYLTKTKSGQASLRSIGEKAGPFIVTLSGLIAEAAIRVPSGKLSSVANWKKSPTRSFWVATSLF